MVKIETHDVDDISWRKIFSIIFEELWAMIKLIIKLLPKVLYELARDFFTQGWWKPCLFFILLILAYIFIWISELTLVLQILLSFFCPSATFLIFVSPALIKELKGGKNY